MPIEVHKQEGEVVQGIDGCDGLIELDGIVQHGSVAPHAMIAAIATRPAELTAIECLIELNSPARPRRDGVRCKAVMV